MTDSFQHLIDFSELIKTLSKFQNIFTQHEYLHKDHQAAEVKSYEKFKKIDSDLTDLQLMSKSFVAGLVSISKIEEKLSSWSERFRSLEEGNFEIKTKIRALEDHYEKQIEEHRLIHKKEHLEIEKSLMKVIEDKFFTVSNDLTVNFTKVSEDIEQINEKVYAIEDNLRSSVNNTPVPAKENENVEVYRKSNTLNILQNRIAVLENKMLAPETNKLEKNDKNAEKVKILEEKTSNKFEELKKQLDEKLQSAFSGLKEEAPEENEGFKGRKNVRVETLAYGSELKGLEKKITLLDEKMADLQKRHSMIEIDFPRRSVIESFVPKKIRELDLESSSSENEVSVYTLEKLQDSLEKIQKTLPLVMYKSELEDIFLQFSKKIKDSRKTFPEYEDFTPKIQEHEERLNGLWKSINSLQEKLGLIEPKLQKYLENFQSLADLVKFDMQSEIKSIEESYSNKVNEVKLMVEKSLKSFNDVPVMQNEQYFRSMILALRNDISFLRDDFDSYKKSRVSPPLPLDSQIELEEIQEPLQIGMLQSILKQHDTAIRLLANKTFPQKPEEKSLTDTVNYLSHLEDLKKEMKEILSKQEERKTLSNKDLEIIQNILVTLESKIGKDELGQMAEKNDLHKIYRMLKRRIDELAEAVYKKEGAPREEAYFLKKKFNSECASCGQSVPEKVEGKLVYESWNKFPVKSPSYATGFSRILNSLVQSPSGGLTLQKEKEPRALSMMEGLASKPVTVKSKKRQVSTRISTGALKNKS